MRVDKLITFTFCIKQGDCDAKDTPKTKSPVN